MFGVDEPVQSESVVGLCAVGVIHGAEEAILRGLGEKEVGEGPLNKGKDCNKKKSRYEGDLPRLPGDGTLPEEIQRNGRRKDKDGE